MNCHKCNGHGDVGCKKCQTAAKQKTGDSHMECEECYGTGAVICHFCLGNGNIE
ncbi:hypothetical protein [Alteribacter aurantiacus]|uniref:hypothetical protein n=1 Tax=Alteribacter aurantiacus TaxID=254410 RepID=UPI0012EBB709|nr:hypothetical protein [Alteribacter aurantiacus]